MTHHTDLTSSNYTFSDANEIARIRAERPSLWSDACIDISQADAKAMSDLVRAVEEVVSLPAYQQTVLATAPEIARIPRQSHGVFFGYDFHLTADGPRLIEINTNAGGAFAALPLVVSALNQRLQPSQRITATHRHRRRKSGRAVPSPIRVSQKDYY